MCPSSRLNVPLHNTRLYVVTNDALRSLLTTSDKTCYVTHRASTGAADVESACMLWRPAGDESCRRTYRREAAISGKKL